MQHGLATPAVSASITQAPSRHIHFGMCKCEVCQGCCPNSRRGSLLFRASRGQATVLDIDSVMSGRLRWVRKMSVARGVCPACLDRLHLLWNEQEDRWGSGAWGCFGVAIDFGSAEA
eukprot:3561881-Alexandrium_andersonii.AAC.1